MEDAVHAFQIAGITILRSDIYIILEKAIVNHFCLLWHGYNRH